jgi:multidrug efflux pump subunit AcrA (membrane-fusion protein)
MSALKKPIEAEYDELEEVTNQDVADQESSDQNGDDNYPPETSQLLSWSALVFIKAPSSRFFSWSIVIVALASLTTALLSMYIKKDVVIQTYGEVLSDFGTRDARSALAGQVSEVRKKVGDTVSENETIAVLMTDQSTVLQVKESIYALKNLEISLRQNVGKNSSEFLLPPLPTQKVISPALEALISLEQSYRLFSDLKKRIRSGYNAELRPLKERASLLRQKLQTMKRSKQRSLLGLYIESTQEELGKIESQIASSENDSKLKLEQSFSEFYKGVQTAIGALESYLTQREVRSPIKGTIVKVVANTNSYIEAGKPIAVIMPENGKFMTANYVLSKDIVKVAPGKHMLYKVEAYPYLTYGSFTGKIDSFEQAKDSSLAGSEKLGDYVVYGTITPPSHLSPELIAKMNLVVGMKFTSEIIVERKTLAEIMKNWLWKQN